MRLVLKSSRHDLFRRQADVVEANLMKFPMHRIVCAARHRFRSGRPTRLVCLQVAWRRAWCRLEKLQSARSHFRRRCTDQPLSGRLVQISARQLVQVGASLSPRAAARPWRLRVSVLICASWQGEQVGAFASGDWMSWVPWQALQVGAPGPPRAAIRPWRLRSCSAASLSWHM